MINWFKSKVMSPEQAAKALREEGNQWLDQGQPRKAEDCFARAVARDPASADSRVNLGFVLLELGRPAQALPHLEEAVRLAPGSPDAHYLLGNARRASGQPEATVAAAWQAALDLKPDFEACRRDLVLSAVRAGALDEADALLAQGVRSNPDSATFMLLLGNLEVSRGKLDSGIARYREALAINADAAAVHMALGEALRAAGRKGEAIDCMRRAVSLDPRNPDVRSRLGIALIGDGQTEAGMESLREALVLDPEHIEALVNLGTVFEHRGEREAAVGMLNRAIALKPDIADAHTNLGDALSGLDKLEEAIASYRRALALAPDDGRIHNNLGGSLLGQGLIDDALREIEQALVLSPHYSQAHSSLLFALNYHPDKSAEEIFAAYRGFERQFALPLAHTHRPHANDRDTTRRIRIGYVSPDLRRHVVGHFLLPLITRHDKSQFEVFAYADIAVEDEVSAEYRAIVDHWLVSRPLSDEQLADRIRADGIDILIDLAGHTANNRLTVFARKPAPVAVSWLGYGYTTGLTAIDYFLTDDTTAPAGCEALFAERPWRMATPALVYRNRDGMGDAGPLPALRRGRVTFGTLTRAVRVNHRTVQRWAEILRRVEGSRLVVDSKNYQDAPVREALLAQFAEHGIDAQRLQIGFHTPPWDVLRDMDIGLDCFPHNSGTTLFETLFLGVPFVTLASRPSVGRLGSSILTGLGHPEWIAHSEEEYVDIAVALASDLPRLAALRASLRAEMQASALMDEAGFVRKVEAAFRAMFCRWAAGAGTGSADEA